MVVTTTTALSFPLSVAKSGLDKGDVVILSPSGKTGWPVTIPINLPSPSTRHWSTDGILRLFGKINPHVGRRRDRITNGTNRQRTDQIDGPYLLVIVGTLQLFCFWLVVGC
jgi:hypothetical protein